MLQWKMLQWKMDIYSVEGPMSTSMILGGSVSHIQLFGQNVGNDLQYPSSYDHASVNNTCISNSTKWALNSYKWSYI